MAQIREFESTTESYFILDGVSYPKVYEAMYDDIRYSDTKIKLVPTNRDTNQLVFSTQYTNILVDGESFDTALEAISRLNQVVFSKGGGSGGGGTGIQSIQEGDNITVDATDPLNPIVSATGGDSDLTLEQARLNGNTVDDVILGSSEFDKQGDRKSFAQLSDVYDNLPDLEKVMKKGNITKYKLRFTNNDAVNATAGDFFFNTVTKNYSFGSLRQEATGTENVGVGFRSLMSLTTGIRNTAIGNNSLELLTTGSSNIAMGSYSGSRLTTEIRNTFIGHNSGLTSKGSSNTYFGALSGQGSQTVTNTSSYTSSYNTGVGTSALIAINAGTYNSALGFQSLFKLTNGIGNVGVGNYSGLNFTTGTSNIFVGGSSGSACDTGNSNIYIGQNSASKKGSTQVVNSNRNIMIGRTSGGGVYGENNVFIGTGAGFAPGTNLLNVNNKLVIHNRNPYISREDIENSITNSENTFETGLITGDFAERWVKFNGSFIVNPTYLLDSDLAPNIIDYPFDIVAKTNGTFGRKTRLNLNSSATEIITGIRNIDGRMIYSRIFSSNSDSNVTEVDYTMPGAYEIIAFERCFLRIPSESSRKFPPNNDYSVQSNWNYYVQDAILSIRFKAQSPAGIRELRGVVFYTKP